MASGWRPGEAPIPRASACCSGTFYGANSTYVNNATANTWPQDGGPYCGIETAIALVNYYDQVRGDGLYFNSRSGQTTVAQDNQYTFAESQWGSPGSINAYGGYSNISKDYGTDPRSIAYMTYRYTPANTFAHDWIYRWQFGHSSNPGLSEIQLEATSMLGSEFYYYGLPLSVTVYNGAHSILVTGVYSNNNPGIYYPAAITGVTYRDPQDGIHYTVDYSTWTSGNGPGGYPLWANYYNNYPSDPEPDIGIYKPASGQEHWYNGFTWIDIDNISSGNEWSPDWSINAYNGAQMTSP